MISDRARAILSEGVSEDEERTIIFLEEGDESTVFRLFRSGDHAGDPEPSAIQWLGRAIGLCRSAPGELRTGMIRSGDEEAVMALVSGRDIRAREWPPEESDESSRLSATPTAR